MVSASAYLIVFSKEKLTEKQMFTGNSSGSATVSKNKRVKNHDPLALLFRKFKLRIFC